MSNVEECGYSDNGRRRTWLPYQRNQDSSALVHDISQEELLSEQTEKYFAYWYSGPQHTVDLYDQGADQCLIGYFGLVEKYQNIAGRSCFDKESVYYIYIGNKLEFLFSSLSLPDLL